MLISYTVQFYGSKAKIFAFTSLCANNSGTEIQWDESLESTSNHHPCHPCNQSLLVYCKDTVEIFQPFIFNHKSSEVFLPISISCLFIKVSV